ncbi:hypothetical protein [Corynebacterium guaraldiae]|uniref:hypothetical protein n=1 Tax=Corynebacterium guaraldiae TaxID=3051103 RepID=UPI001E61FF06|nr:hypothetical protein [Corynebacterium guaraldiae]
MTTLETCASAWAEAIVAALEREFPAAMHHTSASTEDCDVRPRELHPSFTVVSTGTPASTCSTQARY